MVPPDFTTFFSVMAGVGATLFGLIFLVISIKPESTMKVDAPVVQQVRVASSYSALLNPLIISLIVLIPDTQIGTVALIMGGTGLTSTLIMGLSLLHDSQSWIERLRRIFFILSSFSIYGFETLYAIRLLRSPTDLNSLNNLTIILVIIYLYGIARAWDLVGARQFHIQELLLPLTPKENKENSSDAKPL